MSDVLDIEHWIDRIYRYEQWLRTIPLPKEYREKTSYREFHALMGVAKLELGLTPEVMAQLNEVKDNPDLDSAFLELGMTIDNRELYTESHYEDLPLNFYWMDEYNATCRAVDDYTDMHPRATTEELLEVVRANLPELKQ